MSGEGLPASDCRPHRSSVTSQSSGHVSARRSNVSAAFRLGKSVCFQREEEEENKIGKTWETLLRLGLMSLRLSCYQLFCPLVRERHQVLFTENPNDQGKEEKAARYSGLLFGRRLPSHPGLKRFPAEQKLAVKCQLGKALLGLSL